MIAAIGFHFYQRRYGQRRRCCDRCWYQQDETQDQKSRLVGDVDYENVAPKCSFITPVPGGVGTDDSDGIDDEYTEIC